MINKKLVAIALSMVTTSVLVADYDLEKNVISKITNAPVSSINVLEVIKAKDTKVGLDEIVFKIPNSPYKNIAYRVNDKFIFGQIVDKDGVNLSRERALELNKDVIANEMKAKANKDVAAVTEVTKDKFKDIIVTLKGGDDKGKDLYLFTDPKCPYCQQFEKNQLKDILKKVKSVKVVYNPLNIPGHESAKDRAAWGIPLLQKESNVDKQLEIMHKISFGNEYKTHTNTKLASSIQDFANTGVVRGTPTLVYGDGSPFVR